MLLIAPFKKEEKAIRKEKKESQAGEKQAKSNTFRKKDKGKS